MVISCVTRKTKVMNQLKQKKKCCSKIYTLIEPQFQSIHPHSIKKTKQHRSLWLPLVEFSSI